MFKKFLTSKRVLASLLLLVMMISFAAGLPQGDISPQVVEAASDQKPVANGKAPKYIFMFIGDGMSAVQVNAAQIYGGNNEHNNMKLDVVNIQDFEAVGYQTTHDATSFAPDSASTATALSSGFKTWSGTIGLKPVGNKSGNKVENVNSEDVPQTIAERLKREKGMKIGIVSTVTLNHATPAAYYAHSASRNNYYDIAMQMADSGFDYFGGGSLSQRFGKNNDQKDAYEVLREKGYKVVETKEEILALNNEAGKAYAVSPELVGGAMPYAVDNKEGDLTLADFVEKGIDVLDNKNGFFMMVESGKVDWAGHANDAKANISDVLALEDAVQVAIDFAKQNPMDTLIVVTGDHETGGMTIGQATTGYDTAIEILENQKISYEAFDEILEEIIAENPDVIYEEVTPVMRKYFGIKNEYVDAEEYGDDTYMSLELSDKEVARLKRAFDETIASQRIEQDDDEFYRLYGGYTPLTVTMTHILNNKAGIGWTSYSHTGVPVPVYATGVQAELFNGAYDNTEVYQKLVEATKLK
ncbi:MAG: alkaline phosphatase [Tissierellaceae bacterium]|nr:alkaline phosphatase [Tissierellaceae bacterium]